MVLQKIRKILFNMICRLCLNYTIEGNTISLYKLIEMIAKYIRLEITHDDAVSTVICLKCYQTIEDFDSFCTYIEKQQLTLQNHFQKNINCEPGRISIENPYTDATTQFQDYSPESQNLPDTVVKCEPADHSEFIVTEFESNSWDEDPPDIDKETENLAQMLQPTRKGLQMSAAPLFYIEDPKLLARRAAAAKRAQEYRAREREKKRQYMVFQKTNTEALAKSLPASPLVVQKLVSMAPLQRAKALQTSTPPLEDPKLLAKRAGAARRAREYQARKRALASVASPQQSRANFNTSIPPLVDAKLVAKRAAAAKRAREYQARQKALKAASKASATVPLQQSAQNFQTSIPRLVDEKLLCKRAATAKRVREYHARKKALKTASNTSSVESMVQPQQSLQHLTSNLEEAKSNDFGCLPISANVPELDLMSERLISP